ncbi:MAG: DUF4363 family protein [Clostridiales bacterium]|nr:DUF4363 family protein [Clostridiales bacterium]
MKRVIAALAFIAFSVITSLYSYFSINKRTDALLASAHTAANAAESSNIEEYPLTAAQLNEKWEESQGLFHVFLDHALCEDVELGVKQIQLYAKSGDTAEMLDSCYECIAALEHVRESQRISPENIF